MPDLTPQKFQTQGNGIVNLMGGIGAVIAFAGGGILFGIGGYPLPFLVGGLILIGCMAILAIFVREPKMQPLPSKEERAKMPKLEKKEKKSLILLLFAIFFWFAGYNAVETFFSLYATNVLDVNAGQASIMLSIFALSLVIFAIPAGMLGAKIGRRRTIGIGLIGVSLMFIPFVFIHNANIARVLLVLGGICWACVNINSLPMVVRIAGPLKVGAFIGYYYLFSFSSQIITTPIYGFIYDMVGNYQSLFVYAAITFALAFICLMFVRHGEVNENDIKPNEEQIVNNENA
jgi:MFS family permease